MNTPIKTDMNMSMNSDELAHWGILGMKWGVRRFQNKDGTLTAAGKRRAAKLETKYEKLTGKKPGSSSKNNSDDDIEAKKAAVLKSKSAKELYDNKDLFSTPELQAAYNRLNLEQSIKNLVPAKVSKGKKFVDGFIKASTSIAGMAGAGTKAYNNIAKIVNAAKKETDKKLPIV